MNPLTVRPGFSRRSLLKAASSGFGYMAFAGLSTMAGEKAAGPLAPKVPHLPARAKRVIFLCMEGGPSHVDSFDYKPKMNANAGKPIGKGRAAAATLLASPWTFKQHGQSGLWVSDLFPEMARKVDDLCIINGMHTDIPNHPQAFLQLHTGLFNFPRPSIGAWVLYGLGTENENLPGFITLCPPTNNGGASNYGSSFLPAIYQGTQIGYNEQPIANAKVSNLSNPKLSRDASRKQLDFVQTLNRQALERDQVNPAVEGVIESYELAFRMQKELPLVMDMTKESNATQALYGIGTAATDDFGRQCLLARRFAEAGVRFIEVCHGGWDQHRQLEQDHGKHAAATDLPIAGLLTDLKARGLLDDTLVVWGGEFGRTPFAQQGDGRDHNNKGYTMWMAGGGLKGGLTHGLTDEYGYEVIDKPVHIHDLHATILYQLGLDHEKLTFRYAGRDMRLTDIKGKVVTDIIA